MWCGCRFDTYVFFGAVVVVVEAAMSTDFSLFGSLSLYFFCMCVCVCVEKKRKIRREVIDFFYHTMHTQTQTNRFRNLIDFLKLKFIGLWGRWNTWGNFFFQFSSLNCRICTSNNDNNSNEEKRSNTACSHTK